MVYLAYGLALLLALVLLGRAFLTADPAKLARFVVWFGIGLAVALALFLMLSGRFFFLLFPLAALVPALRRSRGAWNRWRGASGPGPGQRSEVETSYLRMSLDHESGVMSGTVRRGPFQGRHLVELAPAELLALWRECRAEDQPSASLLESYLDRMHAGWREHAGAGDEGASARDRDGGAERPGRTTGAMTVDEAYEILGLAPGASEAEIKEAHHRLMLKIHPDQGGSTYLAAQINGARDRLLKR